MTRKTLLILGGSNDQLFMIKTAHEMNIDTVVVDGNKSAVGLKIATYSKAIDFSNIKEVIIYAEKLIKNGINICGVLTMGSDIPHIISKIAKHFSWVGVSEYTAKITKDKFLMKEEFLKFKIPVPNFALVYNVEEILKYWKLWNCDKIIIKPTDSAGSRGVSLITNKEDTRLFFEHAKNNSNSNRVIIEEYIEGPQISTETIVYNNKVFHPGFADRVYNETYNFHPFIMENGGWQPSNLNKEVYDEICEVVEKIVKNIGLKKGVLKGDIVYSTKYKKVMVIEVASRLSGGDFSASLVPLSKGINYVKTAIQIALDEVPDFNQLIETKDKIVANRYFFVPEGILEDILNIEEISALSNVKKLEFKYKLGDTIPKIRSHGERTGVFIVCDESRELVQKTIDYIYETIEFVVNGKKVSGNPKFYKG
ncbi:MAG: ATP-grasp domain-containing protein [Aliarcobacter sp.]|jgi:biotin carboxylase|nr:ATP-grasp domain-containing protein [Aliarcobacter sp.]